MNLQYISDIHLEFYDLSKIPKLLYKIIPTSKICVLAGDIGYPFQKTYQVFIIGLSKKFEHIFMIHGNHEYYQLGKNKGKSIEEIIIQTNFIIDSNHLDNVHFLNNSFYDIDNFRFVGSVLWSELTNHNYLTNDIENITELSISKINETHLQSKVFINQILEQSLNENKSVVMITHYLPSYLLIHSKYFNFRNYNQCFASNCHELIKKPVVCWIFGHTHSPTETFINDILFVANPLGYPGENKKLNFNKTINIL